ncbi:hypothetical protein HUA76_14610 [Myxococcus sp. CA056]|uniref:hypothetical protein n=1 Tax=Myxococcus sp. CA056 TaxID=2741740 RepID=UPI00157AEE5D|nr:hypothetical protein [Myxococcus sp. CA056]NTX12028.1 hypothetical protein [Myxococcus sp. CA056]
MAVYISIRKISENAETAEYAFGLDETAEGRLVMSKATGQVDLLSAHPADSESKGLFERAAHKVRSHWRKGELPDRTCWAS